MALTTFADLTTELAARGFDYLSSTRQGHYINAAYVELCEQARWLFLLTSTTGTAPITIADLRTVESVEIASTQTKLRPLDRRHLTDSDPALDQTGVPDTYYFTGQTTIAVHPANTSLSLTVRYWKFPAVLSGTDEPVVPLRYRIAIVDYAAARAYMDAGERAHAHAARTEGDRMVQFMYESLLDPQADGSSQYVGLVGDDC